MRDWFRSGEYEISGVCEYCTVNSQRYAQRRMPDENMRDLLVDSGCWRKVENQSVSKSESVVIQLEGDAGG